MPHDPNPTASSSTPAGLPRTSDNGDHHVTVPAAVPVAPPGADAPGSPVPPGSPQPAAPKPSPLLRVWRAVWGTTPATGQSPHAHPDGTREIVETVVFVVVLVLMLKSFTAEAFVIPTGSMAETLWGYQKVVTCPECAYQFPVNCSSQVEPQPPNQTTSPVIGCTCPNCFLSIGLIPPDAPPEAVAVLKSELRRDAWIPDPGWNSGDRVLVAKFLYDLFGRHPDRLDVVVFKFPGDGEGGAWPASGPVKKHVPMNYIKRLVGLPGETILIYGGNLYASTTPDPTKYAKEDFKDCPDEESRESRKRMLWRKEYTHAELYSSGQAEYRKIVQDIRDGKYTIVRKPADKILSMRRIVFSNDHRPQDLDKPGKVKGPHWQYQDNTWTPVGTGFRLEPRQDKAIAWLRYRNLRRDAGDKPYLITDFSGYNSGVQRGPFGGIHDPHQLQEGNWVGDLIVECEVTSDKTDGEVVLELSRGPDRFRAVFNLADGFCTLYRVPVGADGKEGKPEELVHPKETAVKGKGTWHLRLANVDQALTVWVDGKLPFGEHGVSYPAPEANGPTANDLEPASIGSSGGGVTVRKISLWRDTYYTTMTGNSPAAADVGDHGVRWNDPDTFAPLRTPPIRSMYVQPDHYLCLGDNSPASSDGRSWGLVPNRLLLGRALLVYYPFYFPWWPLSSQVNRVGLIH